MALLPQPAGHPAESSPGAAPAGRTLTVQLQALAERLNREGRTADVALIFEALKYVGGR